MEDRFSGFWQAVNRNMGRPILLPWLAALHRYLDLSMVGLY